MYYLIRPDHTLEWVDMPESTVARIEAENGEASFDRFEWKTTERPFDPTMLRLALRYGMAWDKGIVVPWSVLETFFILQEILGFPRMEGQEAPNEAFMDAILPGWRARTHELNAKIDEHRDATIAAERSIVEQQLAQPLVPKLVDHWTNLGGIMPPEIRREAADSSAQD